MKVRVLGGSGGLQPGRLLTSFLINEDTVLDAGSMAEALTIEEQTRIDHILLTHGHLDHSGTLPFFVDNIFGLRTDPVLVHALPETIATIKGHLFNNDLWPDFSSIPTFETAQMRFEELEVEKPTRIGKVDVTAIRVNHTVPAVGFILEQDDSSVLFTGDTAQTERLWELANERTNLKGAFLETSFPNNMQAIADASGHLSPQTLANELPKLRHDVPRFVYHIKPRFHDEVVNEIAALGESKLEIVEEGRVYEF